MNDKRWPHFPGWDEHAATAEALAEACGAKAVCSQKYEYLKVEIQQLASTPEQTRALHWLAELIEQASDQDQKTASDPGFANNRLYPFVINVEENVWGYHSPQFGGGGAPSLESALEAAQELLNHAASLCFAQTRGMPSVVPPTLSRSDTDRVVWLAVTNTPVADHL